MPRFDSYQDEIEGTSYMSEQLDSVRDIPLNKTNQHLAIDETDRILQERKNIRDEFREDSPEWDPNEIEELVRNLIISLSGIDSYNRTYVDSPGRKVSDTWVEHDVFAWGEWKYKRATTSIKQNGDPLGYSPNGELKSALIPPGGGATMHIYSEPPPSVEWELTKVEQKSLEFFVGKAKVCEIEAVCSVPSLPNTMDSSEAGNRILDSSRGRNEWQRIVNPKRILSISDFISQPENIIANSALLYCPEGIEAITCTEEGKVEIDFSKFLVEIPGQGTYIDHWMEKGDEDFTDKRPIWLIDGQHRTRGLARNEISNDMEIPIIVFTNQFSLSNAAKIFAEINTLQKPLDKLHTLFMRHRFKIPNSKRLDDFRPWDIHDDSTLDSRQNNLAYECAGWLASHKDGPLYNRIRILNQNQPNFTIIKANAWTEYSRYWFKSQPYGPDSDLTHQEMFQEVENYFQAFVNICNHDEWADDRNRWSANTANKGILQTHSSSRILLDIYGEVWEKAALSCTDKVIPISVFEEVLKPLYWVDWLDSTLYERYYGGGEPPRSSLRIWIQAAIRNGTSYGRDEIMADKPLSEPGKGIFAPPKDSGITNTTPWPIDDTDGAVVLTSIRPEHSRATSRWVVTGPKGREYGPSGGYKGQAVGIGDYVMFLLEYESWMENVDSIDVKVLWSNVNSPAAIGTITLKKSQV